MARQRELLVLKGESHPFGFSFRFLLASRLSPQGR
jgi:hypothetical protein